MGMFSSTPTSTMLKQATIEFSESHQTETWYESDGCLLFFAEKVGVEILSGCRSGYCGACIVELLIGEVVYDGNMSAELQSNEVVLCSAKPATSYLKLKI